MRRIPELDALRGLAALVVMAYHLRPERLYYAWAAVDLFFVLSGYLITAIILKHRGSGRFLVAFYVRRGLRIWPIYYLTLLGVVAVNPLLAAPRPLEGLSGFLTYTQNVSRYWSDSVPPFSPEFTHTWTLAIEEQFYLIWPALVLLVGRRGVLPLSGAVILGAVVARASGLHWWLLATRSDGFALGGLLALAFAAPDRLRAGSWRAGFMMASLAGLSYLVIGGLALGGKPFLMPPQGPAWPGLTLLAINLLFTGVVGLVILDAGRPRLAALRNRGLVYLGQISYGLYLYHLIVYRALDEVLPGLGLGGRGPADAIKLGGSVVVAALSWRFLERPILALKERFAYQAAGAAPGGRGAGGPKEAARPLPSPSTTPIV
jgi:peptidoglycan/LPS O-acetylase OafA/YrhL